MISTGLKGLDTVITGLRLGDNVVWQGDNIDDYISFVLFFMVASGVAFQLPVVLTILVQLRILSVNILKKQRKIAYFVLFVFAEIVTPVSDPIVAPMVVMIPLLILYEGSILVAVRIEKNRLKAAHLTEHTIG